MEKPKNKIINDFIRHWAEHKGEETGFYFLDEAGDIADEISYLELDKAATNIASKISEKLKKGDRLLILLPVGIPYLKLLLGCFYAGVIAIPSYPPNNKKNVASKLNHIVEDATPKMIVVDESRVKYFEKKTHLNLLFTIEDLLQSPVISTIDLPKIEADDIAFLQYSSGSTGDPKGIMVSHENVIANQELMQLALGISPESTVVSWLPVYHDMGLIGCLLTPLCVGTKVYLMKPLDFVKRPYRWLEAISKYKATLSGAPNFAYELAHQKITKEQLANLDLSSWVKAFNGAEPIRKSTTESFIKKFSACGFKPETMYPVYGLAEATLFVSGLRDNERASYFEANAEALKKHQLLPLTQGNESALKSLPNIGQAWGDTRIKIIDEFGATCKADEIGEIAVSGKSISKGYWNKENADLFAEIEGIKYLKTGDYGVYQNKNLYITGRIKEMMIIRGKNFYPQDLESSIQNDIPGLKVDAGAAFLNQQGELVIVQELDVPAYKTLEEKDYESIAFEAVKIISEGFSIKLGDVVLVKPLQIPKTSSGKIRRLHVSKLYADNALKPLYQLKTMNEVPFHEQSISSECRALMQWIKTYAKDRIDSRTIDERRSIAPHIILDFGRKGIFGLEVPKSAGGLGFNPLECMAVTEQIAAADVTIASMVGIHIALGTRPILNYGSPFLTNKWLREIAEGRVLAALAVTENNAGSNPRNLATTAKKTKNGWILCGSKKWIGNAAWSNVMVVIANTLDEQGEFDGVSAFAVETNQKGVRITEEHLTMGVRGTVQNSIEFDKVQLLENQLIGVVGQGMQIAQDAMGMGRLGIGAMALGVMKRSYQLAHNYAHNRSISTGQLIQNPITTFSLQKHQFSIACTEALLITTASIVDTDKDLAKNLSAITKVFSTEKLSQTVDNCMQLLGGRGYMENNQVAQFFRDGRLLRIFEGPTETLLMHLGADFLKHTESWQNFFTQGQNAADWEVLQSKTEEIKNQISTSNTSSEKILLYAELGKLVTIQITKICLLRYTNLSKKYTEDFVKQAILWLESLVKQQLEELKLKITLLDPPYTWDHFNEQLTKDIGSLQTPLSNNFGTPDQLIFSSGEATTDEKMPVTKKEAKAPITSPTPAEAKETNGVADSAFEKEIAQLISELIEKELELTSGEIKQDENFSSFGLDSIDAVNLIVELENAYKMELDPSLLWTNPTIESLSKVLAKKIREYNSMKAEV